MFFSRSLRPCAGRNGVSGNGWGEKGYIYLRGCGWRARESKIIPTKKRTGQTTLMVKNDFFGIRMGLWASSCTK